MPEITAILLDIIPHGELIHIDVIFDALIEGVHSVDKEEDILDRIHTAIDDKIIFADGDHYGRMYYACLQDYEGSAQFDCGCAMIRLSNGAVVLQQCETHKKANRSPEPIETYK